MLKPNEIITEHYLANFERLVKRTTNRVPNRSTALAEECVQEAYARAIKYFRTFRPEKDSFGKWLDGILRNAINDCRNGEKDAGTNKELNDEDGAELTPTRKEKIAAIYALQKMKKNGNYTVLSLFLLYGFKTREIAEFTGMNHSTVRQAIYKWRNGLSELLYK